MPYSRLLASLDRVLGVVKDNDEWVNLTDSLIGSVGIPVVGVSSGSAVEFANAVGALARAVVDTTVGFFVLTFLKRLNQGAFSAEQVAFLSNLSVTAFNQNTAVVLYQYEFKIRESLSDDMLAKKLAVQLISDINEYNMFKNELVDLIGRTVTQSDGDRLREFINGYKLRHCVYSTDRDFNFKPALYSSCGEIINSSLSFYLDSDGRPEADGNTKAILMFLAGFSQVSSNAVFDSAIHESAMNKMITYSIERLKASRKPSWLGAASPQISAGIERVVGACGMVVVSCILGPLILASVPFVFAGLTSPFDALSNTWSTLCENMTGYSPHFIERY